MTNLKFIRENPDLIKEGCRKKGIIIDIDKILKLDQERRGIIVNLENLKAEKNKISEKPNEQEIKRLKDIKIEIKKLEDNLKNLEETLSHLVGLVPNLPLPSVPEGQGEKDNVVLREWGRKPKFNFKPLDHLELGKKLDLIDFETGAKVSGSQFYYLKNEAVLLELALTRYAFDILMKEGFVPWLTPDLVHQRFYEGTGYLPRGPEAQTYEIKNTDIGLIATAEVTLAGIHTDEILLEKDLPKKYAGFSHCFRVEAGGYGKYSRGLYRVHQFSKVEMYVYCRPEESEKMHQYLLSLEERIFQGLKIPYRVVEMCAGDLGAQAARKFDLEAWMPGRGDWGEITSTSNTTDYQARCLNIKYRKKDGRTEFVHTLNGTAIAISRALIAILENYQKKDGSVVTPKILEKYLGIKKIEKKR